MFTENLALLQAKDIFDSFLLIGGSFVRYSNNPPSIWDRDISAILEVS